MSGIRPDARSYGSVVVRGNRVVARPLPGAAWCRPATLLTDRVYEWAAGRWGYRVAYDLSTVAASASEGSSSASVAGAVIGHAG